MGFWTMGTSPPGPEQMERMRSRMEDRVIIAGRKKCETHRLQWRCRLKGEPARRSLSQRCQLLPRVLRGRRKHVREEGCGRELMKARADLQFIDRPLDLGTCLEVARSSGLFELHLQPRKFSPIFPHLLDVLRQHSALLELVGELECRQLRLEGCDIRLCPFLGWRPRFPVCLWQCFGRVRAMGGLVKSRMGRCRWTLGTSLGRGQSRGSASGRCRPLLNGSQNGHFNDEF